MNEIKKITKALMVIVAALIISTSLFKAETPEYNKFIGGFSGILKQSGEEYAINNTIKLYESGRYDAETIGRAIKAYYEAGIISAESVAKIEAAGIPVGSSTTSETSSNNSNSTTVTETVTQTEFTVADVEPYTAWATKDCNIRSGADTTYDKIGSLKQYEQVTVTGQASTGWFRITTSDGTEAYISNTLLTTEDPTSVSFSTVTEEGTVTDYTVEGENAEAVAEVVEQIKEEADTSDEEEAHEHSYTSEVTKEATCTEEGEITYTCECGDTYTETIAMTDHTEGEWEITKEATLISAGEQVKKCTVCGEVLETEVIPANTTMLYVIIGIAVLVAVGCTAGVIIYRKKH